MALSLPLKIDETYMMQLIEHISLAAGYSPINADGSINEDTSKLKEVLEFYKVIADASPRRSTCSGNSPANSISVAKLR